MQEGGVRSAALFSFECINTPDDAKNVHPASAYCGLLRRLRPENPAGRAVAAGPRFAPRVLSLHRGDQTGLHRAGYRRGPAVAGTFRRGRLDLRSCMVRTGGVAAVQRRPDRVALYGACFPYRHHRQMVSAATGAGTDSQRPLPRRHPHLQPPARNRCAEPRPLPCAGHALRSGGTALLGHRRARFGGGTLRKTRISVGTQTPAVGGNPSVRPRRCGGAGAYRSGSLQS